VFSVSGLPFDILVITDRAACAQVGKTVITAIAQILQSPLSPRLAILVRDKIAPQSEVAEVIKALQPMTQGAGAKLFVHTYVELALAFGLDGLHLAGNGDLEKVRSQLPAPIFLGISRHSQDPLDHADMGLADYATISPIYSPTSKPKDTRETLGIMGLRTCVQRSVRPLVALGGMQPGRVGEVVEEGCAAIAICGAILQANHPQQLLEQLCTEIDAVHRDKH
jgi:thiamine-phosphate pyrophosphorylase